MSSKKPFPIGPLILMSVLLLCFYSLARLFWPFLPFWGGVLLLLLCVLEVLVFISHTRFRPSLVEDREEEGEEPYV